MSAQRTGGGRAAEAPGRPGARPEARRRMRRAAAGGSQRGRLTAPCRTTRSAAWSRRAKGRTAARSAQKGRAHKGATRRRYSASAWATRPPWAGRPSAAARRRKLGGGIDAASSAKAVCAYAPAHWTCGCCFRPAAVGCNVGSTPGGHERQRIADLVRRAPTQRQTRGFAPSWQPLGLPGG